MEIDKNITGITADSREVKPGFAFFAIKGNLQDGHAYIEKAISLGAKTIIHQDDIKKLPGINYIKVTDSRIFLSEFASKLYPKQPKYILGITGTNGKTSIVHFVREILQALNKRVVSIGTMGVLGAMQIESSNLNTLPAEKLHPLLQDIAENDIDYVVMECSSHGIDQHRIDHVRFTACGFSNLTQDHLDYHLNMDNYLAAKEKLFGLYKNGTAILNADIPVFPRLDEYCKQHGKAVITYGKRAKDIVIKSIKNHDAHQEVSWEIFGKNYTSYVNLVGEFQIYNLACAIGLLNSTGLAVDSIMSVIENLSNVTGRMELITNHNNANIFVDYAHTPDALEHALVTLKPVTKNKLWVVFGCGGDRDKEKRPIMGKIATKQADIVVITDDNPRSEDPATIRKNILDACNEAIEIAGREEAIAFAITNLKPGDNLLVAGKGHENYQIIGDKTFKFSDKETILNKVKQICK